MSNVYRIFLNVYRHLEKGNYVLCLFAGVFFRFFTSFAGLFTVFFAALRFARASAGASATFWHASCSDHQTLFCIVKYHFAMCVILPIWWNIPIVKSVGVGIQLGAKWLIGVFHNTWNSHGDSSGFRIGDQSFGNGLRDAASVTRYVLLDNISTVTTRLGLDILYIWSTLCDTKGGKRH